MPTARYLILAPTHLKPESYLVEVLFQKGDEVEFRGRPGVSMGPINVAACAAVEALREYRRANSFLGQGRDAHDLSFVRNLAGLNSSQRAQVEAARAEYESSKNGEL